MRVGIIRDYREENWPSMDLCGDMLLAHWPGGSLSALGIRPPAPPRFGWLGRTPLARAARNANRLLNRFHDYPRHLRSRLAEVQAFHLVDHSYAQLLSILPPARSGVFCHDLDTFRCLLHPELEPRPAWFRLMARRILRGFQGARLVFHTTREIRRQLEHHRLAPAARFVQAPYGVADVFLRRPEHPGTIIAKLLARLGGKPFLLHVGSSIPRKRIDVLLDVLAGLRHRFPDLMLAQIGGDPTPAQREQATRLGLESAILWLGRHDQATIADALRHSALVLQPSEAEGFGLPVAESLAAGAIMVASDLPTIREVGADAVIYRPVGDVPAWIEACAGVLGNPAIAPDLGQRAAQARRFSWDNHAALIAEAYRELLSG